MTTQEALHALTLPELVAELERTARHLVDCEIAAKHKGRELREMEAEYEGAIEAVGRLSSATDNVRHAAYALERCHHARVVAEEREKEQVREARRNPSPEAKEAGDRFAREKYDELLGGEAA